MQACKYLIIGGGMTAAAAATGIREVDPEGTICLIGQDPNPPYNRPPLSKGLWQDKKESDIWTHTSEQGVSLHLGRKVNQLDPQKKEVIDDQNATYNFEKLLLATGGRPNRLPFGDGHIIYYRTVDDYRRLHALAQTKERFAVIGGGFIGAEIAAALTMNEKQVTMVFPEIGIGGLSFPSDLTGFLNRYYRERGVEVIAGEEAKAVGLEVRNHQPVLQIESGGEIVADGVVAGIGITPNTELAETAGLETSNGIMVNRFLQTSHPDIYAAGDVASFYNQVLDQRLRVEHEDNANTMGQMAGRAMAGEAEPYDYLPYFYSDLFDLGYEAVGIHNPEAEIVSDWIEPYKKGVIYYLQQNRVRGVILWNVWDQVEAARQLIAEIGPFQAEDLKGRISS
jgi:NADPH-dependent 2,4-dienoyl-CoA reductase/sulfur reductase-like enzyme